MNNHLACSNLIPKKWLDEKSDFHVQMAFDLWDELGNENHSSLARDLLGEVIPCLWLHQLKESEA